MTEIFSLVFEVVKCVFCVLECQFGDHLRNYDTNFQKLEEEVQKLKNEREKVKNDVKYASKNAYEVKEEVEPWQSKVGSIIEQAEELIRKKEADDRCLKANLMKRHKHSKEASQKVLDIALLLAERARFGEAFYRIPPPEIWLASPGDYEAFDSRKTTLENLLKALIDDSVHTVGFWGMGGIGKTTLAKEVDRQVRKRKLFNEVVFVEITETPDIIKIQQTIARKLDLQLDEETERAKKLYARLRKEERILVILDNIWVDIDLETIGIPSGADCGGCKLLLTTREREVLRRMNSKAFPIGDLSGEEAWRLFKKMAGDYIENPELKSVATDVVNECGCLPIAIVTVATALREKDKCVWEDALEELRRPSPASISPLLKQAYSKIEFSYNRLEGDELKKIFLLCSLMPNNASISGLCNYVMGLDMLDGKFRGLEQARNRLRRRVHQLKDSCLLLKGDYGTERFSMHDVVRDVALSIACRHQHVFTDRNDDLREWLDKDKLKQCMKICINGFNIVEPPERLECPELEFFYMQCTNNSSSRISQNFFMAMAKLRVLDFPLIQLSSLPSSLCELVNLQTLCLDWGNFEDVAIIGELKKLQILSLSGSNITQLPSEIGQLAQLRLLDLTYCRQLKVIASNVISSLSRLEELYMRGCPVLSVGSRKTCLEELCDLSQLTTLEIDIEDDKVLPTGFFSKELERYKISIGTLIWHFPYDVQETTRRMLKLKHNSSICLKESPIIKNAEALHLDEWQGENDDVVFELDREGFSQLKHLCLWNNHRVRCLVDSMNLVARDAFPALESFYLFDLSNLEKICRGQFTTESFSKLKTITVIGCHNLKNLKFPFSIETIDVFHCKRMEEIFNIGGEDGIGHNDEVIEKIEFSQLCSLTLGNLPQLTSFYSSTEVVSSQIVMENRSDIPTSLFNGKVVFPKLEVLELKYMNVEKIWNSQQLTMASPCQNLTRLIVNNCKKLEYLFLTFMVKSLEQLQHLEISHCSFLKEIFRDSEGTEPATCEFVFPRVNFLKLWHLPALKTFYSSKIHTSEWPLLKKLEIGYCDNINVLCFQYNEQSHFDVSGPQSLFAAEKINPNLEELTLGGKNITMMWQSLFPQNHFSKLKVRVKVDESTNIPLPILKNLEYLCFSSCFCKEIFPYGKYENYGETPTQIKVLKMKRLYALKYMWKEDSKLDSLLQNLEILKVKTCNKLMKVAPSSASFQNLMTLEVFYCYGLLNIITSSTAKRLVQLREMKISSCKLLIEVIANDKDIVKDEIVFNKLKLLSLENLESLTSFCNGNHTFIFPSLEELFVRRCPVMKNFSVGVIRAPMLRKVRSHEWDMEGQWEGDLKTTIQNLNKVEVNSNSEELTLIGDDIRMTWQRQFPEYYCSGLRVLEICTDESANIPLEILERFSNLEKLVLRRSSYKEIFSSEGDEKHGGTVTQIKTLELWGLSDLKQLWQQDPRLDLALQNLETLDVNFCHGLINLLPNSASFENLRSLEVWCCDGLRKLVTSSMAKSLVQLQILRIRNCELIIEIVENREDEARDDVIIFNNLKVLSLTELESLSSFCSGKCSFNFPALEELNVAKCPKMKIFSKGVLITPKLQELSWNDVVECLEGDLNTTVQQLYKKRNGQSCEKDLG